MNAALGGTLGGALNGALDRVYMEYMWSTGQSIESSIYEVLNERFTVWGNTDTE